MSTILFAFNFQECKLTFLETNQFINGSISLPKGNLVKIQYENMNYKAQIFECEGKELQQSDHYLCDLKDFTVINEKLWWMLIGVRNIKNRLKIIERENFQKFLMRIQLNSICYVNAQIFNTKENLKCSVQYIGEVPEIGPGYFIGFLIVDTSENIRSKTILPCKYFNCSPQTGFIRPVDALLNTNRHTTIKARAERNSQAHASHSSTMPMVSIASLNDVAVRNESSNNFVAEKSVTIPESKMNEFKSNVTSWNVRGSNVMPVQPVRQFTHSVEEDSSQSTKLFNNPKIATSTKTLTPLSSNSSESHPLSGKFNNPEPRLDTSFVMVSNSETKMTNPIRPALPLQSTNSSQHFKTTTMPSHSVPPVRQTNNNAQSNVSDYNYQTSNNKSTKVSGKIVKNNATCSIQ